MEQTNCPAVGLKKWNKWNEVNLIKKKKNKEAIDEYEA